MFFLINLKHDTTIEVSGASIFNLSVVEALRDEGVGFSPCDVARVTGLWWNAVVMFSLRIDVVFTAHSSVR